MAPTPSGPGHDNSSSLGLSSGKGETVLIVDDDPLVRSLTERVLIRLGYTVMAAADATEAVELVGKAGNHVDLMLTDVIMPQQSGPALHQRILDELAKARPL